MTTSAVETDDGWSGASPFDPAFRNDPHPSLRRLREGVELDDGRTAPAKASLVEPDVLSLTIHEGRNRQVRRMCDAIGHPVRRLVRTRIGPLADRSLRPGQWRALETAEVRALERAVRLLGDRDE